MSSPAPSRRDPAATVRGQRAKQCGQSGRTVLIDRAMDGLAVGVDDRDGVVGAGPVVAGQAGWGRLHCSLLAADPSGEAPVLRYQGVAAASLIDRRSMARTPVDGPHTPGTVGSRRTYSGRQARQASRAVTRRHLGCIGDLSNTADESMVHQ